VGTSPLYDRIGDAYATHRRPDPRIAAQIDDALGDAKLVLNIGAGTGSYETGDRTYVGVEPSPVMIAQRSAEAGPVVQAVAEHLPFADRSFDASMAILTVHHWTDARAGITELRRVTRRRIIVLTWDAEHFRGKFWLVRDYLPEAAAHEQKLVTMTTLSELLAPCSAEPVLIPHDCTDGFFAAYWRRPEAYLDPRVRASISGLALLDQTAVDRMATALRHDLESGEWDRRHSDLRDQPVYDNGYRLIVADLN
jgi:SAM-dependent methyltransferase